MCYKSFHIGSTLMDFILLLLLSFTSNVTLQSKLWLIFKVLFWVIFTRRATNGHIGSPWHKTSNNGTFHYTRCFPIFTVLCANLANGKWGGSHMVWSETLVCLDFSLCENKPTRVENATLHFDNSRNSEQSNHTDVKLCFKIKGWGCCKYF